MFFINICILTDAWIVLIRDWWSWEEHSFSEFFPKPFLFVQKLLGFSRELNEIMKPVEYKSDYMNIMILLGLYVCNTAVQRNSWVLNNLITVWDILHEQEKICFFQSK